MAFIFLENMRFKAYHGLYPEEQTLGNHFILDIKIETPIEGATVVEAFGVEQLSQTINYETVYNICRFEMEQPQKLLETVVQRIVQKLQAQFTNIHAIELKLRKLNPPLGGAVAASAVAVVHDFKKECPACKARVICYGKKNGGCWCQQPEALPSIHPRSQALISAQYRDCLCAQCLKAYK